MIRRVLNPFAPGDSPGNVLGHLLAPLPWEELGAGYGKLVTPLATKIMVPHGLGINPGNRFRHDVCSGPRPGKSSRRVHPFREPGAQRPPRA